MRTNKEAGFSLLELIIVLIAGSILLLTAVNMFVSSRKIHQHQQRLIAVDEELLFIKSQIEEELVNSAGYGLGYFTGVNYSAAQVLPGNGFIQTATGAVPIKLQFVTPFRVNNNDAIMCLGGNNDLSRMELVETSQDLGTKGKAVVVVPGMSITKGASQLTLPKAGSLLLLVGGAPIPAPPQKVSSNIIAEARLIKLTVDARETTAQNPQRKVIELEYEFPLNGSGTLFPNLINISTKRVFGAGSVVVPIKLTSFYLDNSTGNSLIIQNDGGSILPNPQTGEFYVTGGSNTIVGKADTLEITYSRNDLAPTDPDSPTPPTPIASWLDKVTSVNITLTRTVPPVIGHSDIQRTIQGRFQIRARTFE